MLFAWKRQLSTKKVNTYPLLYWPAFYHDPYQSSTLRRYQKILAVFSYINGTMYPNGLFICLWQDAKHDLWHLNVQHMDVCLWYFFLLLTCLLDIRHLTALSIFILNNNDPTPLLSFHNLIPRYYWKSHKIISF